MLPQMMMSRLSFLLELNLPKVDTGDQILDQNYTVQDRTHIGNLWC